MLIKKIMFAFVVAAVVMIGLIGVITYSPRSYTWSSEATAVTCDTMVNNCMPLDVPTGQATNIVAGK